MVTMFDDDADDDDEAASDWPGARSCDDSAVLHVTLVPLGSGVRTVVVVKVVLTLASCRTVLAE